MISPSSPNNVHITGCKTGYSCRLSTIDLTNAIRTLANVTTGGFLMGKTLQHFLRIITIKNHCCISKTIAIRFGNDFYSIASTSIAYSY